MMVESTELDNVVNTAIADGLALKKRLEPVARGETPLTDSKRQQAETIIAALRGAETREGSSFRITNVKTLSGRVVIETNVEQSGLLPTETGKAYITVSNNGVSATLNARMNNDWEPSPHRYAAPGEDGEAPSRDGIIPSHPHELGVKQTPLDLENLSPAARAVYDLVTQATQQGLIR